MRRKKRKSRLGLKAIAFVVALLAAWIGFKGGLGVRSETGKGYARASSQSGAAARFEGEPLLRLDSRSCSVPLINRWNPLPDDFEPTNLISLYDQERSFQLSASDILLDRDTFEAANRMFAQAERDGVAGFILTSGYRTEQKQRELYESNANGTVAAPGTSEHQTGLAFDVTAYRDAGGFEDTPQFRWLNEHCWEYGFILRYPRDKEGVTGIPYEPWHYRYVGEEIALIMRDAGKTLEEYAAGV